MVHTWHNDGLVPFDGILVLLYLKIYLVLLYFPVVHILFLINNPQFGTFVFIKIKFRLIGKTLNALNNLASIYQCSLLFGRNQELDN